ncbi:MAG TPA: M12 family metallopeptidase [Kofleriaceae bacterium]|nr:M12 family metallopeptidase [Kofleriaceae bacterium]
MKLSRTLFVPLVISPALLAACADTELDQSGPVYLRTAQGVIEVKPEPLDDGNLLVMGDIVLRPDQLESFLVEPEDLDAEVARLADDRLRAAVRAAGTGKWNDGVIPWDMDEAALTAVEEGWIRDAIEHWEAVTPFNFVERTNQGDYIWFRAGTLCASYGVGRQGGRQDIEVAGCDPGIGQSTFGRVAHEIAHAVGFFHEQSRSDRDTYITIDWDHIPPPSGGVDCEHQYKTFIQQGRDGQNVGPYDFDSIMHYSPQQCNDGVGPAFTPRVANANPGQRVGLSMGDRYAAYALFHGTKLVSTGPQVTLYRDASYQGVSQSFLPGFFNSGNAGDFLATIGEDQATSMRVPPGLSARLCIDDGEPDLGTCYTFVADVAQLSTGIDNRTSAVSVERAVTVYSGQNLTGTRQTLRRGTHYASQGDLGGVGDNQISSLLVPPGLVAELCRDESTPWPQVPLCVQVEGTVNFVGDFMNEQTSLVRVKAAATLWQESRNWGNRKTLTAGTYQDGDWSAVTGISSVSAGDGLQVRMCDFSDGTGTCRVFKGDVQYIGPELNDKVSYVKVEAAQ